MPAFIDAEAEETTYAYDTQGRMSQMFLPENPATAFSLTPMTRLAASWNRKTHSPM